MGRAQPAREILHGLAFLLVVAGGRRANAADTGVDRYTHARGMVLHLLQVGRLQRLIVAQARKLDRIQFEPRGVVEQLNRFPFERPYGIRIEAELDG